MIPEESSQTRSWDTPSSQHTLKLVWPRLNQSHYRQTAHNARLLLGRKRQTVIAFQAGSTTRSIICWRWNRETTKRAAWSKRSATVRNPSTKARGSGNTGLSTLTTKDGLRMWWNTTHDNPNRSPGNPWGAYRRWDSARNTDRPWFTEEQKPFTLRSLHERSGSKARH